MEKEGFEKEKEAMRALSATVVLLTAMLAVIATFTVGLGISLNCWQVTTYGVLLFLLPAFVAVLYRRIVVTHLREVVER